MKSVPILAYHSIDDTGSPISVSPRAFREQMELLRDRGARAVSMKEWLEEFESGRGEPGPSFVLTFDDGYANNHEVVLPILREFGFRATLFLTTDHVGGHADWATNRDLSELPLLDWDRLGEMAEAGFEIEPHTRRHPRLPEIGDAELEEEIAGSKQVIEERLGRECTTFCYPHGAIDDRVVEVVRRCGFRGAVTTEFGYNDRSADPFRLRRIGSAWFRNHPRAFPFFVRGPLSCSLAFRAGMLYHRLRRKGGGKQL
jgi:peptidoglycan/xylan/chitin deacetylase (PgdA/CDA1 family)